MFTWIAQHESWAAVALYWIFSAAVSSMPAPGSSTGAGYLWIYRFLHTLAGNVSTALGTRIPGTLLGLAMTLPLLLSVSACAPYYTVHPGAPDGLRSVRHAAYWTGRHRPGEDGI